MMKRLYSQMLVGLLGFGLLFFLSEPVYAATCNWSSGAEWATATWSCGGVPTSADDVVIDNTTALTVSSGTIDFNTLQIGGGTNTTKLTLIGSIGTGGSITIKNAGTLEQKNNVLQTITGTLSIESGGTLSHTANTTTQAYIINISAATINVQSGGTVTAAGKGYGGGSYSGGTGGGPGAGAFQGGGGAHAGDGGDNTLTSAQGGTAYCDITDVDTMGSGGAGGNFSGNNYSGGAGGGLIILTASGTATLSGAITAAGAAGSNNARAGAGAGGGIKITADTIAGTPTSLTVAGGGASVVGGAGGGGCIQFNYTTSNSVSASTFLASSSMSVSGYTAGSYQDGGVGSFFVKDTDNAYGDLMFKNVATDSAAATSVISSTYVSALTYDNIYLSAANVSLSGVTVTTSATMNNGSYVTIAGTSPTELQSGITAISVTGTAPVFTVTGELTANGLISNSGTFTVAGTLSTTALSNLSSTTVSVSSGGTWNNNAVLTTNASSSISFASGATISTAITSLDSAGTLNLHRSATFTLNNLTLSGTATTTTLTGYTTTDALALSTLTMTGTSILTHASNTTTAANIINISATTIDIGATATVTASGKGYSGGTYLTAGNGPGAGAFQAGGGAHAGDGGDNTLTSAQGGTAYCSLTDVSTMGSGGAGGNFSGNNYSGGAGGGLIMLTASGTATLSGTISANGAAGSNNARAGAGAGGGIKITADTIAGTPTGLTATGGGASVVGGAGGGGCIQFTYTTSNSVSASTFLASSAMSVSGYTSGSYQDGGAGSFFAKDTDSTYGDLAVKNSTTSSTDATTTLSGTYANLLVSTANVTLSGATVTSGVTINNGSYVTVSGTGTTTFESGVTSVSVSGTAPTITNSATLTANSLTSLSSTLTNSGTFNATALTGYTGSITTTGTLNVTALSDLSNVTLVVSSGGVWKNSGTLTTNSSTSLTLSSGSTVFNEVSSLTSAGTFALDQGSSYTIRDVVLSGGTTTLSNYSTTNALSLTSLTMTGTSVLNNTVNTTAQTHIVNISASSLDIGASASINLDGKGYSSGNGPAAGVTTGGGGHGGNGGGTTGGTANCNISNVATMGSAGAHYNATHTGGKGGGLAILNISGTATIDGSISVDGATPGSTISGGGAGGGLKLTAGTIAGAGTITATGGNKGSSGSGGGGGGGCVQLIYSVSSSISSATLTAGTGGGTAAAAGVFAASQVGISLSTTSVAVTEGSAAASYTVVLSSAPSADVDITLSSSDTSNGVTTDVSSLTFTTSNWSTPQTVNVTAADDALYEGSHGATVSCSASSTDSSYNGASCASVTANITDNDSQPSVTLSASAASMSETGGSITLTATLSNASTQAVSVGVGFSGSATSGGTDYTASATSMSITAGLTTGTITLTAASDVLDEADETIVAEISSVTNGTESGTQQQSMSMTDDDATPSLSINDQSVAETAGSASFTVTLSAASGRAVQVAYASSDGSASAGSDYTAVSGTLTFAEGETTKSIVVTVADDTLNEASETYAITLSSPSNATISDDTGAGTLTDNDSAPTVSISTDVATIAESAEAAVVTATLSAASGQSVTVNLAFSGTATGSSDYTKSGTSIVIAPGATTGTVTLIAIDDTIDEPDEAVIVDVSSVSNGTESGTQQQTVTITDNDDPPSVTLSVDAATLDENAVSDITVTATLSGASGRTVTTDLAYSGTAVLDTDYTVSSSSIVIAAGDTTGTATITPIDNLVRAGNKSIAVDVNSVTNGTESGTQQQSITLVDDDPDVTITESGDATAATENGSTDSFTVELATQPSAPVTITFTPDSQVSVSATTVSFTTEDWNVPQTVTVTAVDDDLAESVHAGTISAGISSTDLDYAAVVVSDISVALTDDDSAGIDASQSGGSTSVTEGSGTDSISFVLTSQPTADVSIAVSAGAQVTLSSSSLTFTAENWDAPQSITVTAQNDSLAEDPTTAEIAFTVSSTDPDYNTYPLSAITASVVDNDVANVLVTEPGDATLLDEADVASGDTLNIVLSSQPTADVTVTLTSDAVLQLSATAFVFTSSNWNVAQEVTVSILDNFIDQADYSGSVNFSVASADADYQGLAVTSIVADILDNDTAGVTITESAGTTAIAAELDDSYTVVLNSEPTADVTVALAAGTGVVLSADSLLFTADNWDTPQTVLVSIDDATITEDVVLVAVTHSISSTDGLYAVVSVASVATSVDYTAPTDPGDGDDDTDDDETDDGEDIGGGSDDTDEGSDEGDDDVCSTADLQTIAGDGATVAAGSTLTLSYTASTGEELSCSWTMVSGSGSLDGDDFIAPLFSGDNTVRLSCSACGDSSTISTDDLMIHVVVLDAGSLDRLSQKILGDSENGLIKEQSMVDDRGNERVAVVFGFADRALLLPTALSEDEQRYYVVTSENFNIIAFPEANGDTGVIYLVPNDLEGIVDLDTAPESVLIINGAARGDNFGEYIAFGNVVGDAAAEILVAAPLALEGSGILYIFSSEGSLLQMIEGTSEKPIRSVSTTDFFGGDVDDIVFGPDNTSLNAGLQFEDERVYESQMSSTIDFAQAEDVSAEVSLEFAEDDSTVFFQSVAFGDVNGDGITDMAVATSNGEILIYYGTPERADFTDADADVVITGGSAEDGFGQALALADMTGDGADEIVIGAPDYEGSGAVFIILGGSDLESEIDLASSARVVLLEGDDGEHIGSDVLLLDRESTGKALGYTPNASQKSTIRFGLDTETPEQQAGGSVEGSGVLMGCSLHASSEKSSALPLFSFFALLLLAAYRLKESL